MGVFHVFWMVQMVTNRAMHHITIYLEWNTVVYTMDQEWYPKERPGKTRHEEVSEGKVEFYSVCDVWQLSETILVMTSSVIITAKFQERGQMKN